MTQSTPSEARSHSSDPGQEPKAQYEFYSLARAVQDRFIASANHRGAPEPILFKPAPQSRALVWLVGIVVFPLALLWLTMLGYGEMSSPFAIQAPMWGAVYVLLCSGTAACVAGYFVERQRPTTFPYRLGTYLFPAGVVVAKGATLAFHPLRRLRGVRTSNGGLTLSFPGTSFTFLIPKGVTGSQLEQDLTDYSKRFEDALAQGNRRALAVLDPIRDSGFSNPLSSSDPLRRPFARSLMKFGGAVLAGGAFGLLVFAVRNKVAERALYDSAREADSTSAYEAYLARGGHRTDVSEVLLPRAELKAARGSLDAVEQYAAAHPDSRILGEIQAAVREELLAKLALVSEQGTLRAIEDFKVAHASHIAIQEEIQRAQHSVFEKAKQRFTTSSSASENVQKFIGELIDHSEAHGPGVEVRFRNHVPVSVERADSILKRSAYFAGTVSLPSQYFSRDYAGKREGVLGQRIIDAFQSRFSEEVLHFTLGEPMPGRGDLPSLTRPTLLISYEIEMSGAYTTQTPRNVYVGLGMTVRTHFVIPGRERPFTLKKFSSWLPPDTSKIWKEKLTPEAVYEMNASEGFERYGKRLLKIFVPETMENQ